MRNTHRAPRPPGPGWGGEGMGGVRQTPATDLASHSAQGQPACHLQQPPEPDRPCGPWEYNANLYPHPATVPSTLWVFGGWWRCG